MARRITSKDNPIIRQIKQLESRKHRQRTGLFLIEGPTVLREVMEETGELEFVLYSDSFSESEGADELKAELEERKIPLYSTEDRLFNSLSGTQTPQGIMAAVSKPAWDDSVIDEKGADFIVLDRVADPGNIGTIVRTAEASGFSGIIALKGTADLYSGKVSRASAGALMRMPVFYMEDAAELTERLHRAGKRIICTDPRSEEFCYEADLALDAAIVIGNEASGVSDELFESSDLRIGIPMMGKTESLNAAVASCILMYESLRQRLSR